MTRPMDVTEKVGNWGTAFDIVRASLTPHEMREVLAKMKDVDGIAQLGSYMKLAHEVSANDRTAAVVAAMLVSTGIKPVALDLEGGDA